MIIIQGKILDYTGQPLEFANVAVVSADGKPLLVNGQIITRQSDSNGNFNLPVALESAYIKFSYVGLEPLILSAKSASSINTFKFKEPENAFSEVVYVVRKKVTANKWLWIGGVIVLLFGVIAALSLKSSKK